MTIYDIRLGARMNASPTNVILAGHSRASMVPVVCIIAFDHRSDVQKKLR
jgi:hypothetical protein